MRWVKFNDITSDIINVIRPESSRWYTTHPYTISWNEPTFKKYWEQAKPVIDKKEITLVALKGLIAEMTAGEQYREDLRKQKLFERRVKANAAFTLRRHKTYERFLKEIKNLKLNVLYKPSHSSSWQYFVVRERNMQKESLTLDILYYPHNMQNNRTETKHITFDEYKHMQGTFERIFDKKEITKASLRGLVTWALRK